jgi:hypothetical protein
MAASPAGADTARRTLEDRRRVPLDASPQHGRTGPRSVSRREGPKGVGGWGRVRGAQRFVESRGQLAVRASRPEDEQLVDARVAFDETPEVSRRQCIGLLHRPAELLLEAADLGLDLGRDDGAGAGRQPTEPNI